MRLSFFVASALCVFSLAAYADTISTFQVNGTFLSGSVLSGNVTIDTTTGSVTGVDLAVTAPESDAFTTLLNQTNYGLPTGYEVNASGGNEILTLVFDSTSLVGYTGGSLGGDGNYAPGYLVSTDITISGIYDENLFTGQVSTVTPEPSSFALLGTGLLGVAGVLRKRFV